jgi:alanyl-tRNA synthetase
LINIFEIFLLSGEYINNIISKAETFQDFQLIIERFNALSQEDLKNINQTIVKEAENAISILINQTDDGYLIMGMMGKNAEKELTLHLGNLIKDCVTHFGGKGGGPNYYGQGFIGNEDLDARKIITYIKNKLKQ